MLRRLERTRAIQFVACGVTFVGGAVVMDAVSGMLAMNYGLRSTAYVIAALLEESLELLGAVAFWSTLSDFASERCLHIPNIQFAAANERFGR
jgi:hypothetical protein